MILLLHKYIQVAQEKEVGFLSRFSGLAPQQEKAIYLNIRNVQSRLSLEVFEERLELLR